MDTLNAAINHLGGTSAAARALDITPGRLSNWKRRGVPADMCRKIEAATNGKVTRFELRPDVFGKSPLEAA